MKYIFLLLITLFSFSSSASYLIGTGVDTSCSMYPDNKSLLTNHKFRTKDEMFAAVTSVMSGSSYCSGYQYIQLSTWQNGKIAVLIGSNGTHRKTITFNYGGSAGCNFDDCQEIAQDKCESANVDLKDFSWTPENSGDYTYECGSPPEPEPIANNEECTTMAQNQCFSHNGLTSSNFTDNGDSTLSCDFICNDGTTGDKNGSLANAPDGLCNPADPNDLADCDVADTADPNCVFGCGDAYTPTSTTDIPYVADGTTTADGTGNDGITTTQGDVLINEVINLRNSNAEQTIVAKNAVVDAVNSTNSISKLDEVISAIQSSSGGGSTGGSFDDSGMINSINNSAASGTTNSENIVAAIESNSLENTGAGTLTRYGSGSFITSFLDQTEVNTKIAGAEITLKENINSYKTSLMAKFNLTVTGSGYQQTNLVLSQGTYDISWSRFSQYFASIGAILYALASLISLSIIFQGRM